MHMAYKGEEKQYAYAKESKREGSKVLTPTIYLGKVADRELGVFYKPERGFFTFDCETRQYGPPRPASSIPRIPAKTGRWPSAAPSSSTPSCTRPA